MKPDEAARLGELLKVKREAAGLAIREVARRAKVDSGTVLRIEHGQIASPRPDNLLAIGKVLAISAADLFAAADWMPSTALPTFQPYLRAKYHDLPPAALAEMDDLFERIERQYGSSGPRGNEDERD